MNKWNKANVVLINKKGDILELKKLLTCFVTSDFRKDFQAINI